MLRACAGLLSCHLSAAGESGVDQLVEIIKVLGTPTKEEIHAMNPNYTEFKFPQIKAHPWTKVFSKRMPPDAIDLVSIVPGQAVVFIAWPPPHGVQRVGVGGCRSAEPCCIVLGNWLSLSPGLVGRWGYQARC